MNEKLNLNFEKNKLKGKNIYRFKNLTSKSNDNVKEKTIKYKESQNLGDYMPSGQKYLPILKYGTKGYINTISISMTNISDIIPNIESNIIKNNYELDEITSRLQKILNKKDIEYNIIYKSSKDGDLSTVFHKKCDNIKNTLLLIQDSENKIFGGFTTQTWDGEDINKKDNNCFIFSIDKSKNTKIYDILQGNEAISCNPNYGPIFVNQIKLLNNFLKQGGITGKKAKNFKTSEDFELTGGLENFIIKEVEIFQIK